MLTKSVISFFLVAIALAVSNGNEIQSVSWETEEFENFSNSGIEKLIAQPKSNIVVQIVNHGNIGFLNSNPKRGSGEDETETVVKVNARTFGSIPPHEKTAEMARFIVQNSNWTSIATISSREPTVGYPCNSVVSMSDGPIGKSTGVPYMYVTSLDISQRDLQVDPRASLTMTLAQTDYCRTKVLDPEDPRCAHVILTGEFVKIQNGTQEAAFAQQAMFSKHPVMPSWPADHGFFFGKLHISNIIVLDYFGGASTVAPKDYFKAKVTY